MLLPEEMGHLNEILSAMHKLLLYKLFVSEILEAPKQDRLLPLLLVCPS